MAQPLPYERDFDFAGFQSTHPSTPLPGDKVNLELDQVAETIDQIRERIRILQRDDLQLANQSVGWDQLKPELRNGFSTPTVWATGVDYAVGAAVYVGRKVYAALVAHKSVNFGVDLAAGKWYMLADFTAVTQVDQTAVEAAQQAIAAATAAQGSALAAAQTVAQSAANAQAAQNSATAAAASQVAAAGHANAAGISSTSAAASAAAAATSASNAATAGATAGEAAALAKIDASIGDTIQAHSAVLDGIAAPGGAGSAGLAVLAIGQISAINAKMGSYDTKTAAAAAQIDATINSIIIFGYAAVGDGGLSRYKRVGSEPSHSGKLQSSDGAWWELAVDEVTPYMFGAKGDLVADDTAAFNNCFAFFKVKNCSCRVPSPTKGYAISDSLNIYLTADYDTSWAGYRGKQVIIDKGARFKATAAMYAMVNIGDATWDGIVRDGVFVGGVFDCNNLASVGVYAPFYELLSVRGVTVWNYLDAGFVMGAASTPGSSYEGLMTDCHTNRGLTAAPAGSVSVRWNRGGDNHMWNCILKGHKVAGVSGDGTWNMKLYGVHCWNNAEHGDAQYGFVLKGGNQLIGCQVDMPVVTAAYRFEGADNALIGSNITKDNGAVGGYFVDLQSGATVVAMGCKIMASATHELAGEVTGVTTGYTGIGNQVSGVNSPATTTRRINASGPVGTGTFTVATLPATDRKRGDRAFVTDATATTFATNVVGGGANWVPVVFNGSNWIIG
ncbi:MAG: hypothetical protein IH622_13640 [Ochrobactrum anthropi]|uniref:Uncharacterized protein n=1 Tax=Brucella anthropi TaxID=529 RepID=A0A8I0T9X1_BRUAN|nr:hypothetical protein [Brucella anthropi]MBE0561840.1 hypothetical protein [Brucella anthropi]